MLQGKVNSFILHIKEPRWGSLLHFGEASLSRTLVGPHFSWESAVTNMTKTLKNKCGLHSCSLSALADSEYSIAQTILCIPPLTHDLSVSPEIHSSKIWAVQCERTQLCTDNRKMWKKIWNQLNFSYHATTQALAVLYPTIPSGFLTTHCWKWIGVKFQMTNSHALDYLCRDRFCGQIIWSICQWYPVNQLLL